MLRIGIVSEGPSDWLIIEAIMETLIPNLEFVHIQPDQTLTNASTGWRGVRSWCEENGTRLELIARGVVGLPLHMFVIHVDCAMADKAGVERPCPPAGNTASAVRDLVVTQWLKRDSKPPFVVLSLPAQTHEAWIVATLDPPYKNIEDVECDTAAEDELSRRRLLRKKNGQVKKPAAKYGPLARRVGQMFGEVCECCSQASEFRNAILTAIPLSD